MEYDPKIVSAYRIARAKEDFETAKENLNNEKLSQSINRSYYAMFHAARALFVLDNFDAKKHSGVIRFFNQKYVLTGKIDKVYSRFLATAFNVRLQTDYYDFYVVSKHDAEKQIQNAEEFINMIENYIQKLPEK